MKTLMFAVYDGKSKFFSVPFFMTSLGAAVRAFADVVGDPGSMIAKHPGDYTLYQIGEFDDNEGSITGISPHILVGHGSDFVSNMRSLVNGVKEESNAINDVA